MVVVVDGIIYVDDFKVINLYVVWVLVFVYLRVVWIVGGLFKGVLFYVEVVVMVLWLVGVVLIGWDCVVVVEVLL